MTGQDFISPKVTVKYKGYILTLTNRQEQQEIQFLGGHSEDSIRRMRFQEPK